MTRYNSIPRDQNRIPVLAGISTVDGLTPVPLEVNPATGQLLVSSGGGGGSATIVGIGPMGQNQVAYDTIMYTNTSSTVDTYIYKTGGVAGTTTATITITFIDSTKAQVSTVVRT